MGVCIRWRYWASYSFDVQSTHRKSRFSEHSRSEAPKTASWLVASSGFAENRFISACFFRRRLPRFLSFSHVDAHSVCIDIYSAWKSLFLYSFIFWRDLKCGVNWVVGIICRVFFNRFVSWFAGKVAVAPVLFCRDSSKPTFTTQIKELQRHCTLSSETWSWCQGIFVSFANHFKHLFLHSRTAKILN